MHGKETSPPPPKKKRSMEVLHEVVNEIIWALLKEIEILDTDMDVVVEMDDPSAPGMMCNSEQLAKTQHSMTFLMEFGPSFHRHRHNQCLKNEGNMKKRCTRCIWRWSGIIIHYVTSMDSEWCFTQVDPYPGKEPKSVAFTRNSQVELHHAIISRAHSNLDKVDDLLDRCRITMRRCKRIIYRFHERYGRKEEWL